MTQLKFINKKEYHQADVAGLASVYQQQMLIVAKSFWGQEPRLEEVLAETYGDPIEFWQVAKKGDGIILYDVWLANVDTAAVFLTGKAEDTGVGMIQHFFCPLVEETDEQIALAAALQEAYMELFNKS